MNRKELSKMIKHTKKPMDTVNTLFRAINAALLMGKEVRISGFGTFKVLHIKRKSVYDFQKKARTGPIEKMKIRFRPSKEIEKMLNNMSRGETTHG